MQTVQRKGDQQPGEGDGKVTDSMLQEKKTTVTHEDGQHMQNAWIYMQHVGSRRYQESFFPDSGLSTKEEETGGHSHTAPSPLSVLAYPRPDCACNVERRALVPLSIVGAV